MVEAALEHFEEEQLLRAIAAVPDLRCSLQDDGRSGG
jgi:hypothetical protein